MSVQNHHMDQLLNQIWILEEAMPTQFQFQFHISLISRRRKTKLEMETKMKEETGVIGIMVTLEVIEVCCSTISKAAMTHGMSIVVYFVYFRLLALLFLLPTCFFLYRKAPLPPMTRSTVFGLFLLAFLNYLGLGFMLIGLNYSSPTLSSAIGNLNPAFTFILAVLFRMETLNLKEKSSVFKFIGTIILITGAFTIIFYQGLPITFSGSPPNSGQKLKLLSMGPNWVIGGIFLLAGCLIASISLILKTWVSRGYPFEMMSTMICCVFETVIAVLVAAFQEKDSSAWTLRLDIMFVAIFSSGILIFGVLCPVQLWVSRMKGPVFMAMFKPLQMIFAVILGVTTLGDTLHLGSVLGGATIAIGFYTVMRGKSMEDTSIVDARGADSCSQSSSLNQAPLLQNKIANV